MLKARSLRKQIFVLMALLVALQSSALGLSLVFSKVFDKLDAEAFRMFSTTTETRAFNYNRGMGDLMGNMAGEATRLSEHLLQLSEEAGTSPGALHLNDGLYEEAAAAGAESVLNILRNNSVTGAFVIFGGSNAGKDAENRHSAVFIRDTAPDYGSGDNTSFLMEIGPATLAKEHQIAMSTNWSLDMGFSDAIPMYRNPFLAAGLYPRSEMERYGYWSVPGALLGDQQVCITYSLPLIDGENNPYGVLGIEISLSHLERNYLPSSDLPYSNSFYILARSDEAQIDLDWFVPSGPIARNYLSEGDGLALKGVSGTISATDVPGLGTMYCSLHPLRMYSDNSPFVQENWTLISFVENEVLHETSKNVRVILIGSILITTAISFVAVIFLTWFATSTIARLPEQIRSYNPNREISFEKTGLREIDELTKAIELLAKSVVHSSKITSKIMELTAMPMGGYEVPNIGDYVVLTGFLPDLLRLSPDKPVSLEEWQDIYEQLIAQPSEDFDNIYKFTDQESKGVRWLRIQQADTDTGYAGSVLDVTEEVERSLRLAHELDYDALTRLYSRMAFKREVHNKIISMPGKIGAMVFADLDNLKFINDTYGHELGDRLLIRAGEMFSHFSTEGGIVSRISGDEFAAYLHGYSSQDEVLEAVYRLYDELKAYTLDTPDGKTQRIRFSAGVAFYPEDSNNVTDLLKLSDFAMYEAKHQQKGSLFLFNPESYKEKSFLLDNREAINRLIDEKLIRFALQPIVNVRTGEVFGYEALMRPLIKNFSSPREILSVAEDQSKLRQLERMVMFAVFQYIQENRKQLEGKKIFVNSISKQQLPQEDVALLRERYQPLFAHMVIELAEEKDSPIELLETKARMLKEMGFKLAIDDFGAGYSSEVRVLSLNPDVLKIDNGIIHGIHKSADKQQMVANIISFCRPQGIKVVAVGVEQAEDAQEVVQLGVDYIQGYFTGKPAFEVLPTDAEAKAFFLELKNNHPPS